MRGTPFSKAARAAILSAAEPFTVDEIYNAIPDAERFESRNRLVNLINGWCRSGRLIHVRMGGKGPGSAPGQYCRSKLFSVPMLKKPAPAPEPPVELSELETRWREFCAGLKIEVPEIHIQTAQREEEIFPQ